MDSGLASRCCEQADGFTWPSQNSRACTRASGAQHPNRTRGRGRCQLCEEAEPCGKILFKRSIPSSRRDTSCKPTAGLLAGCVLGLANAALYVCHPALGCVECKQGISHCRPQRAATAPSQCSTAHGLHGPAFQPQPLGSSGLLSATCFNRTIAAATR